MIPRQLKVVVLMQGFPHTHTHTHTQTHTRTHTQICTHTNAFTGAKAAAARVAAHIPRVSGRAGHATAAQGGTGVQTRGQGL